MVDTCLDCCAIFSCRVEMALRPDVLIIFPSRRALTPPAPSPHRGRSVAFPRLTGTTHWLRLLAILPTRLRCRRRAVPRLRLLLRSAPAWTPRLRGLDHLCNAARGVVLHRGDLESSQVPVKPLCACPALRPRRTVRASLSRRVRCCLPLRKPRRLRILFPFEAQSRGLRT